MQKDKNKQTSILQQMYYKYTQHNQIHKCATNSEKENRSVFRGHYSAEQDVDICCYSLWLMKILKPGGCLPYTNVLSLGWQKNDLPYSGSNWLILD